MLEKFLTISAVLSALTLLLDVAIIALCIIWIISIIRRRNKND